MSRVAIVTGAARGLGRAEALALAAKGMCVLAADRDDPRDTVAAIRARGGTAAAHTVDVAAPDAAPRVVADAVRRFGTVDVLVNNAGLVRDAMSFNMALEDFVEVVAVNLTATFALCRAAATWWRTHQSPGGGRAIVNTSSESGLYGNAGQANYAAAKAGVAGLTLTLAAELDRYGVRVNAIAPRARTPMSEAAFGGLAPAGGNDPLAPEHVAGVVAWLVSPAAGGVTGQVLVVSGQEVQVLDPWPVRRRSGPGPFAPDDLAAQLEALLPEDERRHVPRPVRERFEIGGAPA